MHGTAILFPIQCICLIIKDTEIAKESSCISGIVSIDSQRSSMDTMLESIQSIVYILILAAFVLSTVILYNPGTSNFIERYREYATKTCTHVFCLHFIEDYCESTELTFIYRGGYYYRNNIKQQVSFFMIPAVFFNLLCLFPFSLIFHSCCFSVTSKLLR